MSKSRGLGDDLAKVFKVTGVTTLVDKVTEILGVEDCGCNRRQEWLNNAVSYENTEHVVPELIEQNIDDFGPGIYIVFSSLYMSHEGINYHYKIGDKINIEQDNMLHNNFKMFYQLGVIKKDETR